MTTQSKKRHAFVGTGGRAFSFIEPLVTTYAQANELVALCDLSSVRMAYYNQRLARLGHAPVPTYTAERFDEMLRAQQPDEVFVCTQARRAYWQMTYEDGWVVWPDDDDELVWLKVDCKGIKLTADEGVDSEGKPEDYRGDFWARRSIPAKRITVVTSRKGSA